MLFSAIELSSFSHFIPMIPAEHIFAPFVYTLSLLYLSSSAFPPKQHLLWLLHIPSAAKDSQLFKTLLLMFHLILGSRRCQDWNAKVLLIKPITSVAY
ncbi:hypothetical protein GDO86_002833 [Hymenochirus boettgeri]|uniref:Uncharacterized protein n=1 Tax=Hymenochirus boettgeri TaxID=247094 RepID=A0A8T2JYR7_9PIPI|nr:hypothetical protein GDO86_002833 [Hymenochirus boettgeri]